ncbi:MAG: YHS domain-containing protein [Candidatus Omnitrophica bacterium]|nr:YHS domain-containing protein [Candidatus Omnitrophota bacterium]
MEPRKVTYKGKVYNLCCSMCGVDFNKDPEKYSKIAEEEVKEVKEEHHI